jgi:hypothetical protein
MGRGGYNGGSTIIGPRSVGWFGGRGSVTSQPSTSGKKKVRLSKPKKKRKGPPAKSAGAAPAKGNGLTIPEQVTKAKKQVRSIEAEIGRTKHQLANLERQLAQAKQELHRAENLPRRSALGQALVQTLAGTAD